MAKLQHCGNSRESIPKAEISCPSHGRRYEGRFLTWEGQWATDL